MRYRSDGIIPIELTSANTSPPASPPMGYCGMRLFTKEEQELYSRKLDEIYNEPTGRRWNIRYFSKTNESAELPQRATSGSAGYDIRVLKGGTVLPGETVVFHTGIRVHMGESDVLLMFVRSSVGIKRHLMLSNGTGVIDSDYTQEIHVALTNYGDKPMVVMDGARVAQGVFMNYLTTTDDNANGERNGGIGSTGVK